MSRVGWVLDPTRNAISKNPCVGNELPTLQICRINRKGYVRQVLAVSQRPWRQTQKRGKGDLKSKPANCHSC